MQRCHWREHWHAVTLPSLCRVKGPGVLPPSPLSLEYISYSWVQRELARVACGSKTQGAGFGPALPGIFGAEDERVFSGPQMWAPWEK